MLAVMSCKSYKVILNKDNLNEENKGHFNGNFTPKINCFSFFQCRTEILTKRMTNGRDVYRGVNALQAKINLIERYRNRK